MADTRNRGNVIDTRSKDIVDKIFKSKDLLLDQQVISFLKKDLNESKAVELAYDYYKKRLEYIRAKAAKFMDALLRRYAGVNLTTRQIIEKAKKYADKHGWTDGEFHMFYNLLVSDRTKPYQSMFNIPSTPMSRTLGYSIDAVMGDKLNITDEDREPLQYIRETDKQYKQLHSRLILQTLMYTDCGRDALIGEFDRTKRSHNSFKYVHPVLAALYIPKISYIEERTLLASISNIVACKSEGKPIQTLHEYELYWDMITDPNQTVSITERVKPMQDLKNRVALQTKLWESVMYLRLGKYYDDDSAGFIDAVAKCQNNIFDAPDMIYTHDEGMIIRRLFNAFSLRPTVVSIASITGMPVAVGGVSMVPPSYSQITTIPMLTLRLPQFAGSNMASINIEDSLNQPQWFIEGKTLVARSQSIVFSRNLIVFYVNRRFKAINFAELNQPYAFKGLPPTLSGVETLNDIKVNCNQDLNIGHDVFGLRSVVCLETATVGNNSKLIVGSTTCIVRPADPSIGLVNDVYLHYDPQGAGYSHPLPGGAYAEYAPVTEIQRDSPNVYGTGTMRAFYPLAERRGTIFVYVKKQ